MLYLEGDIIKNFDLKNCTLKGVYHKHYTQKIIRRSQLQKLLRILKFENCTEKNLKPKNMLKNLLKRLLARLYSESYTKKTVY